MKYNDIIALFSANTVFKAARKAWNNEAYIYSDGSQIILHKKDDKYQNGFSESIYHHTYQDIVENDWEIIP